MTRVLLPNLRVNEVWKSANSWKSYERIISRVFVTHSVSLHVLFSSVSSGFISQGPRNTAVVAGSNVAFTCVTNFTDDDLCWKSTDIGRKGLLCSGRECRERYSVQNEPTTTKDFRCYSFMIDSCISNDSARYLCYNCKAQKNQKAADVVILRMCWQMFPFCFILTPYC